MHLAANVVSINIVVSTLLINGPTTMNVKGESEFLTIVVDAIVGPGVPGDLKFSISHKIDVGVKVNLPITNTDCAAVKACAITM